MRIVSGEVIPEIEARHIQGFRHIDLLRRDSGDEVEFTTLMWFDNLDSVRKFMGNDYSLSHVPASARAVLSRFMTVRLILTCSTGGLKFSRLPGRVIKPVRRQSLSA